MFSSNGKKLAFAVAGGLMAVPALAADTVANANNPDISDQIRALRARIDQLEAEQNARKDAQRQEDVDSALKDADQHSRMFDSVGFNAGWNKSKQQFFIGSDDGKFYLHPIIIFQTRGIVNDREKAKKNNTDDTQLGFEIRRAKFGFDGNIFTPDLTYKFQWQNSQTGAPAIEYAFGQYILAKHLAGDGAVGIRAGQFRGVFSKEENVGDTFQLMAERSLANTLVGGNAPAAGVGQPNAVQGVDLLWLGQNNPLHAELTVHNGYAGALSTFAQPHGTPVTLPQTPSNPPTNPSYGGVQTRVDWKVFGDWADTADFTGINSGKRDLLDIGGGADYSSQQAAEAIRYTADVQYQLHRKLTLYAAGYGDYFSFRDVKVHTPHIINNFGGVAQGGYLLDPALQLIARYSITALDNNFKIAGQGTFQEIGAGFNWFGPHGEWGNHARFTAELEYLPDGSPAVTGLDYLASPTVKFKPKQEIVLRTQFQIWF